MKAKFYASCQGLVILFLLIIAALRADAQPGTFKSNGSSGALTVSASQTVNTYAHVTNISYNNLYTTSAAQFPVGTKVLIMQMTGYNAGNWQFDSVQVSTSTYVTVSNIFRHFSTIYSGDAVQMVKVPQYTKLRITPTGRLNAVPWSSSTSTGGVLAFMVRDTFQIDAGGKCDVSSQGFTSGAGGVNGAGGAGGGGGAAGAIGQPGGSIGLVVNSGIGGGGDGGLHGAVPTSGTGGFTPNCPGCGSVASNGSILTGTIYTTRVFMGGSGSAGGGGNGGQGAGGGGGGADGNGTGQNGTAGGVGGTGGAGGAGGSGGGVILFTANNMIIAAGDTPFVARGQAAVSGVSGTAGGAGGNGGMGGGTCLIGGGGGGGGGGNGGSGGSGGTGGAGGTVMPILFHASPNLHMSSYELRGGPRGAGGAGGTGGPGGINGGVPGYTCGLGNGAGPVHQPYDICSLRRVMHTLDSMGAGGNGQGRDTVIAGTHIYATASDTVWMDRVDGFTVIVYTRIQSQVYYTILTDSSFQHDPLLTVDSLFSFGHVYYDSLSQGVVFGHDTFDAICRTIVRATAGPGTNGPDGVNGSAGSGGGVGGGGSGGGILLSDCSVDPIVVGNQILNFIGEGCPVQLDANTLWIYGGLGYNYTISYDAPDMGCGIFGSYEYYNITVSDTTGCLGMGGVEIDYVSDKFLLAQSGQTDASCSTSSDGSFTFDIVSDPNNFACTPASGWDVTITNPYNQNTTFSSMYFPSHYTVSGLAPGTYSYSVTTYTNNLTFCSYFTDQGTFTIGIANTPPAGTEYQAICDGASYSWYGGSYSQTGVYSYLLVGGSAAGCDSMANLDLTVWPPITAGNLNDQIFGYNCYVDPDYAAMAVSGGDGSFYNYSATQISATCMMNTLQTSYTVDVTDGSGCFAQFPIIVDFVQDQLAVSINSTTPENCPGAGDGTADYTVVDQDNRECTPGFYFDITGPNAYSQTIPVNASSVSGTLQNLAAGTYNYTILNLSPCAAPVSGSFTISSGSTGVTGVEYDTICDGASLTWNGNTYFQTGVYTYLITGGSAVGCDSTATLDLTVLAPILPVDIYDTIPSGATVTIGSSVYSTSGNYTDVLQTSHGCDSTVNLYLTVLSNSTIPVTVWYDTICAGQSVLGGMGNLYTITGVYSDTVLSSQATDSISELHLYVTPALTGFESATICQGQVYMYNGQQYATAGTYPVTLTAQSGCDSIVTLTIISIAPVYTTDTQVTCHNPYLWNGYTITSSGNITAVLQGSNGCDSVPTLTLTILPGSTGTDSATICQGQSYQYAGNAYTQSGTFTATLVGVGGCDSVVTFTLTVLPPATGSATASICQGGSYIFGGSTYTQAGTYTALFQTASGCDSAVTLTLSVSGPVQQTIYDTICDGETYYLGGSAYTTTGTYTNTVSTAGSCDTLETLHLIVLPSSTPTLHITVSSGPPINGEVTDTFRASYTGCDGAYYSWYLNLQPVGQHDSLAIITHLLAQGDSIICRIDCDNRCASTVYTYSNRIMSGITDQDQYISGISVYPNPNTGSFTVEIKSVADKDASLAVVDMLGQSIMSGRMALRTGDNKQQITLGENTAPGMYILEVTVEGHTLYQPVTIAR